ncbi:acyl-[acyl-carrier-protein]-UDP-N-acetylglucosamine O-acyltransferase [Rhodovulum sulfidophilum]|uniref:Acyl-[acyl-carrier-protein]-UDP-N-acetylglucosamine O-acyltransferase n=1 Tax=Rhodovulum sulfidophilum TaxID=35806 RepID=A0A0D6B944_RHOSU|nr:acyl-[acyl-carrier-protein]-UDP-N-acetylglucosamine O-acyltransferase [Rhodovulum sulfidophilum]
MFAEGSENSEHTAQRQFTSQAAERLAKDEPLPQVSRFPRGAEIAAVHSRSVHLEKMACPAMGVGHAMAADRRGVGAQVAVEFFHRVGLLREEDAVQGGCEPTPGDRAEPPFGDCGGQLGNGGIEIGRDGQPDEPREHLMVALRLPSRGRRCQSPAAEIAERNDDVNMVASRIHMTCRDPGSRDGIDTHQPQLRQEDAGPHEAGRSDPGRKRQGHVKETGLARERFHIALDPARMCPADGATSELGSRAQHIAADLPGVPVECVVGPHSQLSQRLDNSLDSLRRSAPR